MSITRARAYELTEHALHTWAPAACRAVGHAEQAAILEAMPIDAGEPSGTSEREGAAHVAWRALGVAEYRCGGPGAWGVAGEATGPTGRAGAATEAERWRLWALRAATWAQRAGDADTAAAILVEVG